jgi:hypothetical protein
LGAILGEDLIDSFNEIGAFFGAVFSFLPEPIPQLMLLALVVMMVTTVLKLIRG